MPIIYKNNINYGGITFLAGSGVTAGIITAYGGTTAPTGWLLCDGSAVSRETYSELFKAIGTTYGEGDGETTFNVPDLNKISEKKELIWTNSNPTAAYASGTVGNEKIYDAYDIIYTGYTGRTADQGIRKTDRLDANEGILTFMMGGTGGLSG